MEKGNGWGGVGWGELRRGQHDDCGTRLPTLTRTQHSSTAYQGLLFVVNSLVEALAQHLANGQRASANHTSIREERSRGIHGEKVGGRRGVETEAGTRLTLTTTKWRYFSKINGGERDTEKGSQGEQAKDRGGSGQQRLCVTPHSPTATQKPQLQSAL